MPCRGTGKVISNLGGSASTVTCPWCEGEGTRHPGIDAQARWLGEAGEDAPQADGDAGDDSDADASEAAAEEAA
jgi:hypothetical protein